MKFGSGLIKLYGNIRTILYKVYCSDGYEPLYRGSNNVTMSKMTQIEHEKPAAKKSRRGKWEGSQIKIFATPQGVNVVESPIKAKILSILKDGGLNASKIVFLTGKSKSTISAHLKDLMDAGIVDTKPDPEDGRRKIFFIKSRYLGDLSREKEFEKEMDDYIATGVVKSQDPFKFFRFVFRTIRVALMEEGINIDPVLHKAGYSVGEAFYENLKNPETGKLLENIQKFWKKKQARKG